MVRVLLSIGAGDEVELNRLLFLDQTLNGGQDLPCMTRLEVHRQGKDVMNLNIFELSNAIRPVYGLGISLGVPRRA